MDLSEEQHRRVSYIEQKGKSFEFQVKKLENYLKGDIVDPTNAKMRSESLGALYKDYLKYHDELTSLLPDAHQVTAFLEGEARYFDAASAAAKLQRVEPIANSTIQTSNITVTERQDLPKLPETKLPVFSGKGEEWSAFKNKFVALVHSRTDVSDAVKCSQLLDSLTGKALAKVARFDPSDEDYAQAWQTLLEFYDHKRIVAVEHLNAILDLPKLSNATADDLSALLDKARQHLHILDRLGAKPSDKLVVRIIERCLPPATRNQWQDRLELDELPRLEDLFKFMQTSIFKIQANATSSAGTSDGYNNRKRAGGPVSIPQQKVFRSNARSLITNAYAAPASATPSLCPKCNGEHRLFKCSSFHKLNTQERWNFIKSINICRNCFGTHPFPCKNERRCKKCDRHHHTLLHNDKGSGSHRPRAEVTKPNESSAATSTGAQS